MATTILIDLNENAKALARTEYVRLELMANEAIWDAELTDEAKPHVLAYLNRKKHQAEALMTKGILG
jgi:hypothetical protein